MLTYEPIDAPSHYGSRSSAARYMMLGGLCWLILFYLVIKPFKLLDCDNPKTLKLYNSSGLGPRWPLFFDTWRGYENIQWVLMNILSYLSSFVSSPLHLFILSSSSSFHDLHSCSSLHDFHRVNSSLRKIDPSFMSHLKRNHTSIFCWLGKDFAWISEIQSMWIIFVIPTFLISLDFVYVSLWHKVRWIRKANITYF